MMMDKDFTMPLELAWREYQRELIDCRDWSLYWGALVDEHKRLGRPLPNQDDAFESWLLTQRKDFENRFHEQVRAATASFLSA
jgi:hypothetical protein